ncbi:MAG: aminoglycoside phosphotransferase family protein [Actinomycetota bacterium]|nr:aminoglycoside phosphotransferase family protein [Actinomycetota bacterium]
MTSGADEVLERALSERFDGGDVVKVERRPSENSSSYHTEVVTVGLADGSELRLFLKDYGTCRYQKDGAGERGVREWLVYRDLLAGSGLGTPEYYGAAWDEARGRLCLLLEFVDGPQLKWCGFDRWVEAAAWLGRMQARLGNRCPSSEPFLVRHGPDLFASTGTGALRAVAQSAPALRSRVAQVLDRYTELIPLMAAGPNTVVHGGYRPQNIVVSGDDSSRIAPADWEEAGIGSPFYDFAYFSDGFDEARRRVLLDAFREEAASQGVALPTDGSACFLIDCFNLCKNLGTLAKSADRAFPGDAVLRLVETVESLAARLSA